MKKTLKVYVVGPQKNYANFLYNFVLVDDISEADVVIFTGGEDVDPALYGAKKHPTTYCNRERDDYEMEMFKKIRPNQLAVGICRGSQFLCVMNGGKLVQDICNHAIYETHEIYNHDNDIYEITSTHHQMQYPFNLKSSEYDVLFFCNRSGYYEGDGIDPNNIPYDVEITLYHKKGMPKCLAIQGHPEFMRSESPVVKMINDLVLNNLN